MNNLFQELYVRTIFETELFFLTCKWRFLIIGIQQPTGKVRKRNAIFELYPFIVMNEIEICEKENRIYLMTNLCIYLLIYSNIRGFFKHLVTVSKSMKYYHICPLPNTNPIQATGLDLVSTGAGRPQCSVTLLDGWVRVFIYHFL